ncbi:transposase [Paraburkholderia sp. MMS20-SJTN17]|uniref:Transposase n=1 Tax=Paraburkholderia translucens TaxID=2886945 RepID=A0ABS8K9W2_9BURK|nr:transposase [Paraburkholderia sp. MMS20-SJTN17]MCC8401553.1 transposase [Paraburkholderia sp. MMS20-SJTN17]
MNPYRDITDEEWQRVAPLLPELRPRTELRGRPLADTRSVLNGVLWVMYSGSTWSAMPRRYPSYQTCHRRFKSWYESGVIKHVTEQLAGAASEDLCKLMEARMRMHSNASHKRGVVGPAAFRVPPVVYNPASAPPVPASPLASPASLKQAA